MNAKDTLARDFIQGLLNGDPSNGATPTVDDLGQWADPAAAIQAEFDAGGKDGARRAYSALIRDPNQRGLAELIAGDPATRVLDVLTADQILTTDWPEPTWAIPQYLPAGLTILAGKAKLGKSWLVLQIARAVAVGGVVFSQRIDEAGPALYLALEDTPRRLQDRMKKQTWPQGLPVDFVTMGEFKDKMGSFLEGGAAALARQIERKKYHLVIVDTLSRACFDDPNRNEIMAAILAPVQELANTKGVAILLVDHHHKGAGGTMDAVSDILGGTSKGATLDTAWGLYRERGKQDANLAITGREVDEQNISLTFDKDTGLWQYQGDYYALKVTEKRLEYLTIIQDLGGKAKNADVAKNMGVAAPTSHQALNDLVTADYLNKELVGTHVFYVLTDQGEKIIG